jgi:molybdenum cofactor guanylyltransferase
MNILGAVIAGGQSSRMGGREKSFLALGGATLIERTVSRLRFQVADLVINANGDAARFDSFQVKVIADALQGVGTPLAGLHAALVHGARHGFDAVVTVPSDAPFLPLDLVTRLHDAGHEKGAAIARSGGHDHFLTGIWTTELAKPLERLISETALRRVQDFVTQCAAEKVVWAALPHDPFFNINTPDDLAEAEMIARGI